MSETIIRISKEQAQFIECTANREGDYYWFEHYFKKVGEQLFELVLFKETPGELKHIVERSEDPNPEGGNVL